MQTCEICGDEAHTRQAHQEWLDWHQAQLAGAEGPSDPEPELPRSITVDPRELPGL